MHINSNEVECGMEKRRFGRIGHMSSVAIFGAVALAKATQAQADETMKKVIAAGVNHIDVAPSYGDAEEHLRPCLAKERKHFFLGCKTEERTSSSANAELHRSLKRLGVDSFDLYQIHAITTMEELDRVTAPDGALKAIKKAREEGLTRYIGITGHGVDAPKIFLEALRRFDFDSVLFPINYIQYANKEYRRYAEELLRQCRTRDVGTMIIKSIARGPWKDQLRTYDPWYQPFSDATMIQQAVNFVLSQDVTGLCTVGDMKLLPLVLDACEHYTRMSQTEQEGLIENAIQYKPLFA
jgi:predicted aldo/keto reductase-like oxidoreductase